MRIVVEGIDGVGKTQFVNQLAKVHGLTVIHLTDKTPRDREAFEEILIGDDWIMDRGMYGQFVYDKRPPLNVLENLRELECSMIAAEVKVIYLIPKEPEVSGYDNSVYHKIVETRRPDEDPHKLFTDDKAFRTLFAKETLIKPIIIEMPI